MFMFPAGSTGYQISNSLRFRSSASAYLSRTFAGTGNRKTWTWSAWAKRGALGSSQALFGSTANGSTNGWTILRFTAADVLQLVDGPSNSIVLATTAVFRDPSSWYHIVVTYDTTNATASLRQRIYVNNVLMTLTGTPLAQNADGNFNLVGVHNIGAQQSPPGAPGTFLDGYLSEINFIDGQALDPSSFGQTDPTTGQWVAKKYAGTYGTNGFYLPFNDGSSLANLTADKSGNGNNWTANNVSLTAGTTYGWMVDTPTNNYAVLNPLERNSSAVNLSNGNLTYVSGATVYTSLKSSISPQSGSFYCELLAGSNSAGDNARIGIALASENMSNAVCGNTLSSYAYSSNGGKYNNSVGFGAAGATWSAGDLIGISYNGTTIEFFKNGVSQGAHTLNVGWDRYVFCFTGFNTTSEINFGQRPFAYTPPTGFKALCTANLPAVSIANPKKHFDVLTWVGNSASSRNITGLQFQPDLAWIKSRSGAVSNVLHDSVRGPAKTLKSDTTAAEISNNPNGYVSSFNSDGITLAAGATNSFETNENAATYVDWMWKAGGSAVANNAGSIASQVSANVQAGISIVTYTGNGVAGTVGHGLGVVPKMVIAKPRSAVGNWAAWHASLVVGNTVWLNVTNASQSVPLVWNSTAPTSSVFSIGATNSDTNTSGVTQVAYCFAEVAGFSRFGSYVGNGSADGTFVYCGFRPRFIMTKRTDVASQWYVIDTARDAYNAQANILSPNASVAESANTGQYDELSNGFKLRSTNADNNANGGTYIFAAFAENPFGGSNVPPANAR